MYYSSEKGDKGGKADFKKQYAFAESKSIPYAVLIGEDEAKQGLASVRDLKSRKQNLMKRGEVVDYISALLSNEDERK
jgi:histidyl-tRNA synthetase